MCCATEFRLTVNNQLSGDAIQGKYMSMVLRHSPVPGAEQQKIIIILIKLVSCSNQTFSEVRNV